MGNRFIDAIGSLLLEFEARMVTSLIWICWICGITTDEIERVREQQLKRVSSPSHTSAAKSPVEPGSRPTISRR